MGALSQCGDEIQLHGGLNHVAARFSRLEQEFRLLTHSVGRPERPVAHIGSGWNGLIRTQVKNDVACGSLTSPVLTCDAMALR